MATFLGQSPNECRPFQQLQNFDYHSGCNSNYIQNTLLKQGIVQKNNMLSLKAVQWGLSDGDWCNHLENGTEVVPVMASLPVFVAVSVTCSGQTATLMSGLDYRQEISYYCSIVIPLKCTVFELWA